MATDLDSLSKIDLEQIKLKLRLRLGWSKDKVEFHAWEYVQFLHQFVGDRSVKAHPPNNDMDEVWHQHILYTEKYREDCLRFIGYFLHHKPDWIDPKELE